MIKLSELTALLSASGYSWANTLFEPDEGIEPPFIVLVANSESISGADNLNWLPLMSYDVEFYARRRDYEAEKDLQALFDNAGLSYTKTVIYIESEDLTETVYTVDVYED